MSQTELWNGFYDRGAFVMHWPSEVVVQFLMRRAKRNSVGDAKVLDLGCGAGRHVWLAADIGYQAFGVDVSEQAIESSRVMLKDRGVIGTVEVFDGSTLPFEDESFDYVVSFGVLDHVPFDKGLRLTNEVKRVLKPGGEYLVTLRSKRCASPDDVAETVARNEYVLTDECEDGMIQHFFEWDEISTMLADLNIVEIELKETSTGEGLSVLADSRWHIVGRKDKSD
jgi:ubiquinone/menaquinone biosynthesis C-methylase UbiE